VGVIAVREACCFAAVVAKDPAPGADAGLEVREGVAKADLVGL
jgi:hypothetical protein